MKYIIFLLLFIPFALYSQQVKKDFTAIAKTMQSETYTSVIEYKYYLDDKLKESTKTNVYVDKTNYRIEVGGMIKINNSKMNLMVDNNNKKLVVAKPESISKTSNILLILDTFLSKSKQVTFSKINEETGKYFLLMKDSDEKSFEVFFNLKSFQVSKIKIVYEEKEIDENENEMERTIEISYLSFTKLEKLNSSYFDISSFLFKKGSVYKPQNKYTGYHLVNLLKH